MTSLQHFEEQKSLGPLASAVRRRLKEFDGDDVVSRIWNHDHTVWKPDPTLFIVAGKSGTTLETLSHFEHFYARTGGRGSSFIAITDPGTPLEELASSKGFRRVFQNPPDLGGRYSALSLFGLVPAALI